MSTAGEAAGAAMTVLDAVMATLNDLQARLKRIEDYEREQKAVAEFSQRIKDQTHE
jgi:hypothetical protein